MQGSQLGPGSVRSWAPHPRSAAGHGELLPELSPAKQASDRTDVMSRPEAASHQTHSQMSENLGNIMSSETSQTQKDRH